MDPGSSGAPFVWALLQHAINFAVSPEATAGQRGRSAHIATVCAVRLHADATGHTCEWVTMFLRAVNFSHRYMGYYNLNEVVPNGVIPNDVVPIDGVPNDVTPKWRRPK